MTGVQASAAGTTVELEDGTVLAGAYTVAADGMWSPILQRRWGMPGTLMFIAAQALVVTAVSVVASLEHWHGLMQRYGTEPTCYSCWIDSRLIPGRTSFCPGIVKIP